MNESLETLSRNKTVVIWIGSFKKHLGQGKVFLSTDHSFELAHHALKFAQVDFIVLVKVKIIKNRINNFVLVDSTHHKFFKIQKPVLIDIEIIEHLLKVSWF